MLKILQDSLKTGGMTFVQLASIAIASILWAREIGPAEMGQFVFVLTTASTAAFICNPSLYAAANYFISAKKATVSEIWATQVVLTLGTGVIAIGAAIITHTLIRGEQSVQTPFLFVYIGLLTLGIVAYHNFSGVLYGSHQVSLTTLWGGSWAIGYLLSTLWLLYSQPDVGAQHPIAAYSITHGIQGLGLIALAYPRQQQVDGWNINLARQMVSYGASVYFGRIATFLNQRFDAFLIITLIGERALGLYGVATTLGELLWQLPFAITSVLLANLAALDAETSTVRAKYTARLVFTIVLFGAFALGIISNWLVPLVYGQEYVGAVLPLLILLPGIVLLSSFNIIDTHFRAMNKPLLPSYAAAFSLLINIVCNIVLIPKYQLAGAALSSTIAYGTQAILLALLWGKHAHQNWFTLFIPIFRRYTDA